MASQIREKHFKIQSFVLSTFHWKNCTPLKMKPVCKNAVKKIQVSLKVLKHKTFECGKFSFRDQFREDGGSKPLFKKTSEHQHNLVGNTSFSLFSKLKIRYYANFLVTS